MSMLFFADSCLPPEEKPEEGSSVIVDKLPENPNVWQWWEDDLVLCLLCLGFVVCVSVLSWEGWKFFSKKTDTQKEGENPEIPKNALPRKTESKPASTELATIDELKKENSALKEKLDKVRQEALQTKEKVANQYKKQIQQLEDELERKNRECNSRITAATQKCEAEKNAVLAEKDGEITKKDSEIRKLKSNLGRLKEEHEGEVSSLRKQIDSERRGHQDELVRKDRECDSRITELRQEHEAEKLCLTQDFDTRLAAKDEEIGDVKARSRAEIERLEKSCAEMLSRFWPDASGGNAELATYVQKWISEMRDSENIPDSVMGMLSQLFCWNTAVRKGKLTAQYDALVEFSRNFFEWCGSQGVSAEDARALAVRFAEAFNTSVLTNSLIPEDKRYNVFVPEIGVAYDAKRMVPSSVTGAKAGTSARIETWGVITAGKKPEMKKRANVILK